MRYKYQSSAYGNPWSTKKEGNTLAELEKYQSNWWLKMLAEQHHQIIDTEDGNKVVWSKASKIAPPAGSRKL